ncbi:MAG: sigma-54-dependent transcriptional regulator [Rhodoferax sp.]
MTHKAATILLVEDDEIMGESLQDRFSLEGMPCDWQRLAFGAREAVLRQDYRVVICDIRLPDMNGDKLFESLLQAGRALPPFLFITGQADVETAVRLLKMGARDYLTKPFDVDALIETIRPWIGQEGGGSANTLGVSAAMRGIEDMLPRLAIHHAAVLIVGESGVGKEQVAKALHELRGAGRPFIAVNCGALTESLLEAELFGYEKGAFTGAQRQRHGVFEQASGGTLFLDEVGDMPLAMQVKLLRALQEKTIVRVGGETPVKVDFRLFCATHRDLKAMVEAGEFREDLYYRINVLCLRIPPLRERREDIPWLARRLLEDICRRENCAHRVLSPDAEEAMLAHPWPGNVRELRHALERACILGTDMILRRADLFGHPLGTAASAPTEQPADAKLADYLACSERQHIEHVLSIHEGHIQNAAKALGISRKNLWEKMRKLHITKGADGVE